MNHTEVIQRCIDQIGAKTYLEIGLGDLTNFNAIKCEYKQGVDPNVTMAYSPGVSIEKLNADEFFGMMANTPGGTPKFDVIFIDGLHHADQVKLDIENAIACLNVGGVILVHDINPHDEEMTVVPRKSKVWTGDVYKAWYAFNVRARDANVKMLADDFGIGIIAPGPDFKLTKQQVKNITFKEYKEWIEGQFTQL